MKEKNTKNSPERYPIEFFILMGSLVIGVVLFTCMILFAITAIDTHRIDRERIVTREYKDQEFKSITSLEHLKKYGGAELVWTDAHGQEYFLPENNIGALQIEKNPSEIGKFWGFIKAIGPYTVGGFLLVLVVFLASLYSVTREEDKGWGEKNEANAG